MKVRYDEVRDCAQRVRRLGDEVTEYVGGAAGELEKAGEGNEGFGSLTTYRDVIGRLLKQSREIGTATGESASALAASADAHERTDETVRTELNTTRDALGRVPTGAA